ncbi:hypothetical protein FHS85_003607 [Rhodoligotrophos appendicifer]|uniref:BA14K family protein n=1 Tax=Rhodoligotrophos appendicifer TaxID=987056 RepID=UPI0011854C6D|nr:BA14K family protein [Rhodoligotrophos appendicifer]
MIRGTLAALGMAVLVGTAGGDVAIAAGLGTASRDIAVTAQGGVSQATEVRYRHHYYPHRYGPRYRYARPGFGHYYGGYYYSAPWWLGAGAYAAPQPYYAPPPVVYGGGNHVQYCMNRYRSYDPRTDTYLGYDGYRHRCVGPY